MANTPARFTKADLARAIVVAERHGKSVRVLPDGSFQFIDKPDKTPVDIPEHIDL